MKTRKIQAAAIALILSFSLISTSVYGAEYTGYKDVAKTHWAYGHIQFASEKEIIKGYPGGIFKPDGNVTCEEAVSMLYGTLSAAGKLKDTEDFSEEYKDMMDEANIAGWSRKVVSYALKYDIITPEELNRFIKSNGGGEPALREQTAVWAGKAMSKNLAQAYTLSYSDSNSISSAAVPYVDLMYRQKVMVGNTNGQFQPKSNVRRSEFAAVCRSIYEREQDSSFDPTKETVNISGTVTAVSAAENKIILKTADGITKTVIIADTKTSLQGYEANDIVVIGYCVLGDEGGVSITLANKNPANLIIYGTITDISALNGAAGQKYYIVNVKDAGGKLINYLINSDTEIFDVYGNGVSAGELVSNTDLQMICDGIKILEIKLENK